MFQTQSNEQERVHRPNVLASRRLLGGLSINWARLKLSSSIISVHSSGPQICNRKNVGKNYTHVINHNWTVKMTSFFRMLKELIGPY